MKVQNLSVDKITPYPKNPRKNEEAVSEVMRSLSEFGFQQPLVLDENNEVIVGHTRLKAAKALGFVSVPCVIAKELNEAQIKSYRIMDNKSGEIAEWDIGMLGDEVREILNLDYDTDMTGFSENELLDLGILEDEGYSGNTDEDAVPDITENPVTVEGDVWILGNHKLMCGDSTSIDAVDKLMDGHKADMVFTDPPYGIDIGNQPQGKGGGLANKIDYGANNWDKDIPHEAINISITLSDNCVLWGGNYYADKLPPSQCWIVWDKDNGMNDFADVELAWTSYGKASRIFKWKWSGMLQQDMKNKEKRVHPTQKPTALAEWTFDKFNCGKNVVDLFGGSGSTLIACEKTNRYCRMMELDPKYCDVIIKRWQDFTRQEAVLESTGKKYNELASQER